MAKYIGFRVQIYDGVMPNSNLIADLGAYTLPILTWTANAPDGWGYRDSPNYYSAYVSDADKMGGVTLSGNPNYYNHAQSYGKLLEIAPLAVERPLWGQPYSGNYLRLSNASGYYATHDSPLGPSGSLILNRLCDNEGNVVSRLGFLYTEFGYEGSVCMCVCLSAIFSNGNIDRIKQIFTLQGFPLNNNTYYTQNGTFTDVNGDILANYFNHCEQYVEYTDPYVNGGDSGVSEPNGDFDDTSDPIDFPSLPSLGAVDSGFITLFNPDLTELQALARYMWTNPLFDISAWKKVFADPMDAILGLSIVPVAVPDSAARPIIVGNIVTDVSMKVATQQFVEVQCGSLNVNEFWSAYLDYEPYTKAEIYLPFCGVHQLSVDDIMNKTVEVRYHIDILSGACCAFVKCGESVLYQFIGQCSSSIPISGNDFTNVINGVLSATTAIGSLVATGGASAPLAVPSLSATALNALKPNIEKSGAMGGTGGMLAIQKPYLVLTRPKQAHPENQNHYTGYPSFITENLGDLSGYTEIEKIHLEGVSATDAELSEIETLLKGGVIL